MLQRTGTLGEPSLAAALDAGTVHSLYQPIVDLRSCEVVGYEALARGPRGSRLESPAELFAAAHQTGLRAELEWACQTAALEGALEACLGGDRALFLNVESSLLGVPRPEHIDVLLERALGRFPVHVELTERALATAPAQLLSEVARLRRRGVGIALDDVGAEPASVALMPFLSPDVIKLDLGLVQRNPSGAGAAVVHAVGAEAERTGAVILAEGIETDAHLKKALALGARYGQGWLFGRPGELERCAHGAAAPLPLPRLHRGEGNTSPFEIVARRRPVQRGDKRLLLALSRQLEQNALQLGDTVLLSSFQHAGFFTPATATAYAALAERSSLVGALAEGLSAEPVAGVRGASLSPGDPLRGEWDVTLVGPHAAMAFVARDLGDSVSDMERRFDFAITYDREPAIAAAHALMCRLAAV